MKRRILSVVTFVALLISWVAPAERDTENRLRWRRKEIIRSERGSATPPRLPFSILKRFQVIERDQLPKIFQERDPDRFHQRRARRPQQPGTGSDRIGVVTYSKENALGIDGTQETQTHIDVRMTDVKTGQVVASISSRRVSAAGAHHRPQSEPAPAGKHPRNVPARRFRPERRTEGGGGQPRLP